MALKGPQKKLFVKAREAWTAERQLRVAAQKKSLSLEQYVTKLTTALDHTTKQLKKKDLQMSQLREKGAVNVTEMEYLAETGEEEDENLRAKLLKVQTLK